MTRFAFLVVAALGLAAPAFAQQAYWGTVADRIAAEIAKAEGLALAGSQDEAKKAVTHAYFGHFETSKMEAALRKEIGSKHAYFREKQFGDLRKLFGKATPDEVKALSAALRAGLTEDGKVLDKAGISPDVFAVNQ